MSRPLNFLRTLWPKSSGSDLLGWEKEILDHYYSEPVKSNMVHALKQFKSDYCAAYGEYPDERVLLAVYKCGKSKEEKLEAAIQLAISDWRDVLVAAKFANSETTHLQWKKNLFNSIKNRKNNEQSKKQ